MKRLLVSSAILILFFASLGLLLRYSAHWMVQGIWRKSHYAYVADGQWPTSLRTDYALSLQSKGWIDTIIVGGQASNFEIYGASAIYIRKMLRDGADTNRLYGFLHGANSTIEEAQALVPILRTKKIDTVAIITSNYHAHRCAMDFNAVSGGKPYFYSIPFPQDSSMDTAEFWSSRNSLKTWFLELLKTIKSLQEITTAHPEKNLLVPDLNLLFPARMVLEKKP